MFSNRIYIRVSLAWLLISIIFALILRSSYVLGMGSWFNYSYFIHTHSHLAFLGWAFNIIYYFLLENFNLLDKNKYVNLFLALNVTVVGMLFTFPIQGYALWSIIFSTLHIFFSFFFVIYFIKDTKNNVSISRKFSVTALFFMLLSSLGPLSLAPIISAGLKESIWYDLAIYFYLHFQYNGFFILSLLGFLAYKIETKDLDNWNRSYHLFVISTILNFSLSTLWTNPGWVINIMSVLSSLMQIHAIFLISKDIIVHLKKIDAFKAIVIRIILILLIIKIFFSLIGSIQEVADFVYISRNLIIGYLHLIFLGIVTPYFLLSVAEIRQKQSTLFKQLMTFYFIAFLLNVLMLTLSALGFRGDTILILIDLIVYSTWLLGLTTIFLILYLLQSTKAKLR